MAKKRVIGKQEPDQVSKYKSPNTGEYVMASQYIAEVIINRKADKEGVKLEYKYWNNKEHKYHSDFKGQVSQAAKLLKKYSSKAIIKTMNDLFWCFSLRSKVFLDKLEQNNAIIIKNEQEAKGKVIEVGDPNKVKETSSSKKTILSRLRAIKNGEKS